MTPAEPFGAARTLAGAGYRTVILGKWGFDDDPRAHGFEEVVGGPDESLVDTALDLLARSDARPLFLYLNFHRPHVPLEPDPTRVAAFAKRPGYRDGSLSPAYAAVIEEMDRTTGRLLAASPSAAVRDGDWKLIHSYETDAVELYDLAHDPGESRDLAPAEPARAAAMRHQLDAWRESVGAQPPAANPRP